MKRSNKVDQKMTDCLAINTTTTKKSQSKMRNYISVFVIKYSHIIILVVIRKISML